MMSAMNYEVNKTVLFEYNNVDPGIIGEAQSGVYQLHHLKIY